MRDDARRNRERIVAAAEAVFGEHGAAGSTEEVARRAGVGIGTVFRHFPTKDALVEAALLAHFAALTELARGLAGHPEPGVAVRELVRTMVAGGATKITLIRLVTADGRLPADLVAASTALRDAFDVVLRRAQHHGAARAGVTVAEVYLLIRALGQAAATMPTPADTLDRAVDLVLVGLTAPGPAGAR